MAFIPIDFKNLANQEGINYWTTDRNLQSLLDRYLPKDEETRDLCMTFLAEIGERAGSAWASVNAANDAEGASLYPVKDKDKTYNEVKLPKGTIESEREVRENGLYGTTVDEKYKEDGLRMPYVMETTFGYFMSTADAALYLIPMLTSGVANTIEKFGSEELKNKYLPRLCSNDPEKGYLGAMLLTEANAGSDVGATSCSAKKDGENWRISGNKMFITTPQSDVHLVLARPEGGPAGTKGLGLFLVPKLLDNGERNGVFINKLEHKMGINASATAEMSFQNSLGYAVGDIHSGFAYMLTLMNISRLKIGVQAIGITRRSFLEAAKYAAVREAFGQTIDNFPAVRELLVDMAVDCEANTQLFLAAGYAWDKNYEEVQAGNKEETHWFRLARILTPMTKMRGSDEAVINCARGIQVLGGYGYIKEYILEQLARDAQITTLYEGTNEIQALDVLRSIQRNNTLPAIEDHLKQVWSKVESCAILQPYNQLLRKHWQALTDSLQKIEAEGAKKNHNYGNLVAKRFTNHLIDLVCASLLLEQAYIDYTDKQDWRAGVVLHRYCFTHLNNNIHRGITSGDMTCVQYFDQIVRGADLAKSAVDEANWIAMANTIFA